MAVEAPLIEARMAPFHELYGRQELTAPEFTALFIIQVLSLRYPKAWLGAKIPSMKVPHNMNFPMEGLPFESNIKRRLQGLSLGEVFNGFALKAVPLSVNRSLLNWSGGAWPLILMFRIPGALEVLGQQKLGRRCVTVLTEAEKIRGPILGERDSLSFTLHDLIHADHFYFDNHSYRGQLGLYGLLDERREDFQELLTLPDFHREFEYLIADMNAYPVHSLKCLKAAFYHYGHGERFERWAMNFEVAQELLALNTANYDPHLIDAKILGWLDTFRKL